MAGGKRSKAPNTRQNPRKRSGVASEGPAPKKPKLGKENKKARPDKMHIAVPEAEESDDPDMEVDMGDMLANDPQASGTAFLQNLDQKGISVSKRVIEQQRKAERPKSSKSKPQKMPPASSFDDDEDAWSSTLESLEGSDIGSQNESDPDSGSGSSNGASSGSEQEQDYERRPRPRPSTWDLDKEMGPARLPVKLADGTVKSTGNRKLEVLSSDASGDDSDAESELAIEPPRPARDDVATGARYGRPAVVDVLSGASRKAKVQRAKEELATICQDIVADPENSLGLLRRLHTFALESVSSPTHPEPVHNDIMIRKLAVLSEMAVFKDIIPGYRIRVVTDAEKAQKISQIVLRQRDFEQGLLSAYQNYLKLLEKELKLKSELADAAIQCMCTLLTDVTHFNYRVNIMNSVVAYLSKKSWDASSDICLASMISVFRDDQTGAPSLELVRILNRMIKERNYRVHPNVLSCLLHLRLRNELHGVRASQKYSFKDAPEKKVKVKLSKKEKKVAKPHLSKKAKQAKKELKEIEEEMAEATMEVDAEEKATQHTESLKLLFVLYFSIIKNPRPTRLLSGALEGISRYAHLVNIDFFRDLLAVLKTLVQRHEKQGTGDDGEENQEDEEDLEENDLPHEPSLRYRELLRRRLLCITTAFELLSGQGDAITIDLGDFINYLYVITLELAMVPDIEEVPAPIGQVVASTTNGNIPASKVEAKSIADLLFRTVYIVFNPRASVTSIPPWRTAAFAKRILISSLSWPPSTVLRALEFVEAMLVKEPKLEALLSTEDQTADGVYRGDLDDPQLCNAFASNFWELRMLASSHWDERVRKEAKQVANHIVRK